jgi:oligopeptide/dipeptide ABC transporter ATP-binding protein
LNHIQNLDTTAPLVQTHELKVHFSIRGDASWLRRSTAVVHAVDGVSLAIQRGETFGLVGESGCGKSTLGRAIMGLQPSTSGKVLFEEQNISILSQTELRKLYREMQIIFQDPFSSLNPRMTVGNIVSRPLKIHTNVSAKDRQRIVAEILQKVGLSPDAAERYPHEFSGGQRQRIVIARALVLHPKLVIADEPTSALDVSIQAQILTLLEQLKQEFELAMLFITHDLGVVRVMCDKVAVMYLGQIVELAATRELFENPIHPYTRALLSAIPEPDPAKRVERIRLQGGVPSAISPPSGCRLHPRCPFEMNRCSEQQPILEDRESGHWVACFL